MKVFKRNFLEDNLIADLEYASVTSVNKGDIVSVNNKSYRVVDRMLIFDNPNPNNEEVYFNESKSSIIVEEL